MCTASHRFETSTLDSEPVTNKMSDLNLLKSWNPKLLKNKKKVWEAQQALLEENKKIKERQKEIEQERELERYSKLNRDGKASFKDKKTGMEWMYQNSPESITENDDYLLGKKQLTDSLIDSSNSKEDVKKDQYVNTRGKKFNQMEEVLGEKKLAIHSDLTNDDPMLKFIRAKQNHSKTSSSENSRRSSTNYNQQSQHNHNTRSKQFYTRSDSGFNGRRFDSKRKNESRYDNKNYRNTR